MSSQCWKLTVMLPEGYVLYKTRWFFI